MGKWENFILKIAKNSRVTQYLYSPKLEGKITTAFAAVLFVFFIIKALLHKNGDIVSSVIWLAICLTVAVYGIYFWRFRTKPIARVVEKNSISFRLYHSNKILYVLYTIVSAAVYYFIFAAIIMAADDEFSRESWAKYTSDAVGVGLFIWFALLRSALNYYQYDRSPKETHCYTDGLSEILGDDTTSEGK